ncbi:hypothetical protein ELH48_01275 [Rhizobium ruizarguesonis]|uniref:Uncharacterized protein n=1 Tax=Rhizobium ruizarguesonis TaxID=2081791 RepID=A0AAE8QA63_9HYPH|nr:hypothetical protein [Rhizobium ruizarguesonis]TBB20548.1 hypothetical protein ELH51_01255 [Rhizobium ruizarguesonis]TBB25891.1 hypothetical protein ELH48_01275 [Rhizobium ruizarguesonis]TBB42778.1 hypothetical protein ELH49_01270 [Rhizobium ruizarguesonis]TBD62152.1 hypothetical protein ELH22_01760 [Rhizobium ruizarguesonis]
MMSSSMNRPKDLGSPNDLRYCPAVTPLRWTSKMRWRLLLSALYGPRIHALEFFQEKTAQSAEFDVYANVNIL